MALRTLSLDYTRIIHSDRVPLHFDIVRKKDRQKKCIAFYINGFYLKNNLDMWKMYKNGQKVCKILNKKKYKNYLKGVYIELLEGPDNPQNRGHEILSRVMECMDNENKENTRIFVTCLFYLRLCSYDNVCKNLQLFSEGICCRYCLPMYYSIEEAKAGSEFFRRFAHMFI